MQLSDIFKDNLNVSYLVFFLIALISFFTISTETFYTFAILSSLISLYSSFLVSKRKSYMGEIPTLILMFIISSLYLITDINLLAIWQLVFLIVFAICQLVRLNVVSSEVGFLVGIFIFSAYVHSVPALMTNMLEEIDPYYHFKWAEQTYNTGVLPEHDWLTYPKKGGLDRSLMPFGNPLSLAFMGFVLNNISMAVYDSSMLFSGLISGLTVIAAYFMLLEFFSKYENRRMAAMVGSITLMLCIAWSMKAHATDSEDDAFGGFLLISLMWVFLYSLNNGDNRALAFAGILFGFLVATWDGNRLFVMVICGASVIHSLFNIAKNRTDNELLFRFLGLYVIGNIVWRFIQHPVGFGFSLIRNPGIDLAFISIAVAFACLNYIMVVSSEKSKWIRPIGIVFMIAIGVIFFNSDMYSYFYKAAFVDVKQSSVVFKTIAEQMPFADSISSYMRSMVGYFGPMSLISLCCIIPMFYLGLVKDDARLLIFASWAAALAWGLYFKSQYSFAASIPLSMAGAFICLFMANNLKELNTIKIVPTLLVGFVLLFYLPINIASTYNINSIFSNYADYSRVGWDSALQYLKTTPPNTAVVTWWDYGHWLTAVSHKFVLIDNLQIDHYEIQDVARFFMKETDEEKAVNILRDYQKVYDNEPYKSKFGGVNLSYVVIDWTMVGKSGAMHFIATGNLTTQADGDYGYYPSCEFDPSISMMKDQMTTDGNGGFINKKTLLFRCTQNNDRLAGIRVDVLNSEKIKFYAIDETGTNIDWESWKKSKDASIFGVDDPNRIVAICMQYSDKIGNVPPSLKSFVYSSKDLNNYMMARLYFGDFIEQYKAMGLTDVTWGKSKYFISDQTFEEGFVKTWKINLNPEVSNVTITDN